MKLNRKLLAVAAATSFVAGVVLCCVLVRSSRPAAPTPIVTGASELASKELQAETFYIEIRIPPEFNSITLRQDRSIDPLQDKLNEFEQMKRRSLHLLAETP